MSGQRRYDSTEAERAGDGHYGTEEQLRVHIRQSHVPKLLPTVLDTVHGSGLKLGGVDTLQACDKGQEGGTEGGPSSAIAISGVTMTSVLMSRLF